MTSSRSRQCDVALIGLGLAGASLAWTLHEQGVDVLVIDDADRDAASRVAAGLVTPATGSKLKPQPGFAELAGVATEHYEYVAGQTGAHAYSARPALRFLTEPRETGALDAIDAAGSALVERFDGAMPAGLCSDGVPVIMPAAGRLAIAAYIDSTRRYFAGRGAVIDATLAAASLTAKRNHVRLESLGVSASNVVFCRGYRDSDNPFFPALRWRAARGQILVLDCPDFDRRYTVHGGGIWLTAADETTVLAGATYEWDQLDATVTSAARDKLEAGVKRLIELPYRVVGQRAAVRPIVEGRMPVIGRSPVSPRIWLMNGLGSKGALFAPTVAKHLVAAMHGDAGIPETYSLEHRIEAAS